MSSRAHVFSAHPIKACTESGTPRHASNPSVLSRHSCLNMMDDITLTLPGTPWRSRAAAWPQHVNHVGEREQIGRAKCGTARSDDDKWVSRDDVGPRGGDLPQAARVVVKIHAVASPAVAGRDQRVLSSEQWVVRMGDSERVTRLSGIGCSRSCYPKADVSASVHCCHRPPGS